jgi:uncharacterized protein (TIGR03437 family)
MNYAWAFFLCVSCAAQSPLTITGVANSADFKPGFSQRGSLSSIFLTGLQGTGTIINTQNPLPTQVLDIQVWVNFTLAPIVSIAFQNDIQQINIQVPWEGGRDPLYLEVFQGLRRASFEGPYTNTQFNLAQNWSVFFVDVLGHAVIQHAADYSPVTPQNPAQAGEYLIAYGINLGPVTNVPKTGYAALTNPPSVFDTSTLTWGEGLCAVYDRIVIGSSAVTPTYDGLAPGLVGIYQINFQVPAALSSGETQLAVQRTLTGTFGPCQPSQPGFGQQFTTTVTSAPASISIH